MFCFLIEKHRETTDRWKEIIQTLIHSPNTCNNQGWGLDYIQNPLNYYRSVTKVPKPLPVACDCCSAGSWIRPEEMGHESDALTKDLASQQNMMAVSTAHPFWILLAMMTVVVHYIYHKLSQFCGLRFLTLNCTHYA